MKLTDRDTKIINFINECGGATIEQIQKLFFPSYDMSANRLKILADNKFLKVKVHPVLGKKVYYTKKMPSFHTLCITDIAISLKDDIKFMQREYKIKNHIVDCIFVLKSGKIIVLEVDIYNRTKESKIKAVLEALEQAGAAAEVWIAGKRERKEKIKGVKYIEL